MSRSQLWIDPNHAPEAQAIAQLLAGNRGDGAPVPGKQVQRASENLAALPGMEASTLPGAAEIASILDGKRADGSASPEDRAAAIRARFLALYRFHANREPTEAIELLRRALGPDSVPELLTTVRQQSARERETSLMFHEGRTVEAMALKRADGTAQLVPGGCREAVAHVADLWATRRAANAHDPDYTLTVSAPTNADSRVIGAAIRERRRDAGELGADQVVLDACDQLGAAYALPLISADGIVLRNANPRAGLVKWDTLRDSASGRIRLSYGDALTIDAAQGLTSTEHIQAMLAGTLAVTAFKAYTAASRHRRASYLIASDGAERREIAARRPLGDPRPIREADVWANMARNLAPSAGDAGGTRVAGAGAPDRARCGARVARQERAPRLSRGPSLGM